MRHRRSSQRQSSRSSKSNSQRLIPQIERLELRSLLASDIIWNDSNWDAAADAPDDSTIVKGADAFYFGGHRNVGLNLSMNRVAIATENASVQLPDGLTRLWGMANKAVVYQTTDELTPTLIAQLSATPGVLDVSPVYVDMASGTDMSVLNEIIVGFKPNQNADEFFARHTEFASFERVMGTQNQYVGKMAQNGGRAAIDLSNRLLSDGATEWVHPNFYVNFEKHFIPNDPRFNNQWHLRNLGQSGGVADADSDVDLAWDVNQGGSSSIVVAVIDDGVQAAHPDLNVWINPGEISGDGIDNDGNGWVDDINGWNFVTLTNASEPIGSDAHGTAVAGVAAARGNNSIGVAGAAYNSRVMSIKVFHDNSVAALDDFASALLYAAGITADGSGTWRAGDLVNNSWGGGGPFPSMNAALAIGVVEGRGGVGATYFFSSGNNGSGVLGEPSGQTAFTPGVIAVGSTNNQGVRSSYSQYGAALDILAPSNGGTLAIDTTDRTGGDGYAAGDYTGTGGTGFGGTSSASPLAAGIGALALAQAQALGVTLRPADFRAMIRNSTDLIGGVNYNINTGKHIEYGFGRVNAFTLVDGVGKAEISVVDTTRDIPSGGTVNMGAALAGQFIETTLRVRNQGTEDLTIDSITMPASFSVVNFVPTTLSIGEVLLVTVRFSPTGPGNFTGDMFINNNDTNESAFRIRLVGTATSPRIGGTAFEDFDNNGIYNSYERGVSSPGFAYIDTNTNGSFDIGERQANINADGDYAFNALPNGTYDVRFELAGWDRTTAVDVYTVTLSSAASFSIGNNFGYGKDDRMYARVIDDLNANGVLDGLDLPLPGFVISSGTSTDTYNSTGPVPIVDVATSISTITIPGGSGLIRDINVRINLTHTFVSDLDITLIAPDSTEIVLASGVGANGDNFTNTIFDDSATISIVAGNAPFTGTFRPAQPLSNFNGLSLDGTWTLKIDDLFFDDFGTLLDWSMEILRDLAVTSDANGWAPLDLPSAATTDAIMSLQPNWEYTLPSNGIQTVTTTGVPIYGLIYGARILPVPPTDLRISNSIVFENEPIGTLVGRLTSTDPNRGETFSYSLVPGVGDTGNAMFVIVGDQVFTNDFIDFEQNQSFDIRVASTDSTGLVYEESLSISVINVNEDPLLIDLFPNNVNENAPNGQLVGTLRTFDTDFLTDFFFTYELVAGLGDEDNSTFAILGNTVVVSGPIDFETKNVLSIRIRTTDDGGLFTEQAVTINVRDINEAPTGFSISSSIIPENSPAPFLIGRMSVVDPDAADQGNHLFRFTSTAQFPDNNLFEIRGDELYSLATFSFESRSSYVVSIRALDSFDAFVDAIVPITITDLNEAPTRIDATSASFLESLPVASVITTLVAADQDVGDTISFTLVSGTGSDDNGHFLVSGNQLVSRNAFDFETKSSYRVRVRATDALGLWTETPFTFTVQNVNETPLTLNLSATNVNEGLAIGSRVGNFSALDPDTVSTFTFAPKSSPAFPDNDSFSIVGNELRTKEVFRFAQKNSYSILVQVIDQGGLAIDRVFTINVVDVNDTPTDVGLSVREISESAANDSLVGQLSTVDADAGDSFVYSLVAGAGSADNASFRIEGNQLRTNSLLNFEAKSSYAIRVLSRDAAGAGFEKSFVIQVLNENEAPTAVQLSALTIRENNIPNAPIGSLGSTDPDAAQSFTYSLVNGTGDRDNSLFVIVGTTLRTTVAFDFEAKPDYQVRIRTTDGGGLSFELPFVISVQNANESPFGLQLLGSLTENAPLNSVALNAVASDPDANDQLTFSLISGVGSNDNGKFTISANGGLSPIAAVNFESQSSYNIRVRVVDRGGIAIEQALSIAVANQNEAPTNVMLSETGIDENQSPNAVIGLFTAVDQDVADSVSFSLVGGAGDTDNNLFVLTGNTLRTTSSFDFETKNTYSLRVRATDAGGLSFEKTILVSVKDVNEQPFAVNLSSSTLLENAAIGSAIGDLGTIDVDALDRFSYSLVAGVGDSDNGRFVLDGATLRSNSIFDFESRETYTVRIRTQDQGGLAVESPLTISIRDINDLPTNLQIQSSLINENSPVGTSIGAFTASDQDAGDVISYRLVAGNNDNSLFSIVNGQLTSNTSLNFESRSSYQVAVQAFDRSGSGPTQTFAITVRDVNETPTNIALDASSINENRAAGTVVGQLSATDPDANEQFTFTLVSGDGSSGNSLVTINGTQLVLASALNFESNPVLSVRVRATDAAFNTFEKALSVAVVDLPEAPTEVRLTSAGVSENLPAGTVVGTLSTIDPDAGGSFTYQIVAGQSSLPFAIVGNQLRTTRKLNFEAIASYTVSVRSTDASNLSVVSPLAVSVLDVNEQAIITGSDSATTPTNRTVVIDVLANDRDPDGTIDRTTVVIVAPPTKGSVRVLSDGRLEYTPPTDERLDVSFSYRVMDNDEVMSNVGTVAVKVLSAYQNPQNRLDVDKDGDVTPLDVLQIINDIEANRFRDLPTNVGETVPYIDTNGNGKVDPLDVLDVINFINRGAGESAEGEQSSSATSSDSQVESEPEFGESMQAAHALAIEAFYRELEVKRWRSR
jgi:subtilisin family serine protease/subtilisin-like proprotein convertase family protein